MQLKEKSKRDLLERNRQASENVGRAVHSSSNVQAGKSFAHLFQNGTDNSLSTKPPIVVQFLKIANMIFNSDTLSLEGRIEKFLESYKSLSVEEAKRQCLLLLEEVRKNYEP